MKKCLYAIFLVGFVYNINHSHQSFNFTVNFYIRNYPELSKPTAHDFSAITQSPGSISQKILENINHKNSGVFVTYYGYITISDYTGFVQLPLPGKKASFKLLITPMIRPMFMLGLTIHHWQTIPSQPAQLYTIEKNQDSTTKLFYWKTQKAALPENKIIDLDTITIFADPQGVYVPEGITLTIDDPQFHLPDLYARKNLNTIIPALSLLNIRQFFGPLINENKKQNDTSYSSLLTTPGK